jgi:hypothetical protein
MVQVSRSPFVLVAGVPGSGGFGGDGSAPELAAAPRRHDDEEPDQPNDEDANGQRMAKRHLSDVIYERMVRDANRVRTAGTGPGGHSGATLNPARTAQSR